MTTDTIPLIVGEMRETASNPFVNGAVAVAYMKDWADRLAALGWRPIETAPKDGSLFLCWVDAVHYGERGDDGSFDTADCSDVDFCQWRDSEHGGYFMNMMGDIGDGRNITHWMPLPAAPTGVSDD